MSPYNYFRGTNHYFCNNQGVGRLGDWWFGRLDVWVAINSSTRLLVYSSTNFLSFGRLVVWEIGGLVV